MRIDNNARVGNVAGHSASRSASGAAFIVDDGQQAGTARALSAPSGISDIGSLLALQAVDDPLQKRRKLVRRGQGLLDTLEAIRGDLLIGELGEGRLNQLMSIIGQARDGSEPGLDALLDDIELRVRVELAKRGLYPA